MKTKYPNGYTASVIDDGYGAADGLHEVAVMHDGHCVYDTPITNDVIGWLTDEEVDDVLAQIAALPPR